MVHGKEGVYRKLLLEKKEFIENCYWKRRSELTAIGKEGVD